MNTLSKEKQSFLQEFGFATLALKKLELDKLDYSEERHQKLYSKVTDYLVSLGIHNIELDPDNESVTIYLERPGILIGYKGENIDFFEKALGKRIKIREFNILQWLIPIDYYCKEALENILYDSEMEDF
jgi:transcription antitermination factor NusA-like protein